MLQPRVAADNPKKGIISRIICKNFITYSEVEVCPGENLNIILGPNGTGKSTLVCAIVLGLCGRTKVIGRSEDLSQYIKMGHREAMIEIELNNPEGDNFKIRRQFNRSNKSDWFLNGGRVPQKRVEKVVRECKIQVDNLCQFLPQDRVQDFAKMNNRELLEQTQRSIDGGELSTQLEDLKNLRKDQNNHMKLAEDLKKHKEAEIQKNVNLEGEVQNAARREEMLKELEVCKQKQAFLQYQNKRQFFQSLKTRLEEKKEEERAIKATQKEYEQQIAACKKKVARQTDCLNQLNTTAKTHMIELKSQYRKTSDYCDRIEDEKNDLKSQLQKAAKYEADKRSVELHIERLTNDLLELDQSDQDNLEALNKQLLSKRNVLLQVQGQDDELKSHIRTKEYDLQAVEGRIAQESNALNAKEQLLRNKFPGVYEGVEWLRANIHSFEGKVYEPMFLLLNVDEGYAKFIENTVPNRDLLAFTCEKNKDTSRLIDELRTKRKLHGISVVTAPPYNGPATDLYKPRIPIEDLKPFGFQQYLLNTISGPDAILHYLAKSMNLHNIPVGGASVNSNTDQILKDFKTLGLFFSDDARYRTIKSRYARDKPISSNTQVGNAFLLRNNVNTSRLDELAAQKQSLLAEREQLVSQKEGLQGQLEVLKTEVHQLNTQRSEKRRIIDQQRIVRSQLNSRRLELEQLEQNKIDPDAAKTAFKESARTLVARILGLKDKICQTTNRIKSHAIDLNMQKTVLDCLKNLVRKKTEELDAYKKSCREAITLIQQLTESVAEEAANIKLLKQRLTELCKGTQIGSEEFRPIAEKFQTLPDDADELESYIFDVQARVDILAGSDNNSLQEYEQREKEIKRLEREIIETQSKLDEIAAKMSTVRDKWYPRVKFLVKKIDEKFKEFFESFDCGGRVELYEGENESNYEEYGINIKVKFRDNSELQSLDAHTQSGGERAVSTAIYMLSMQELTDVPFRVVDEINQGMDSSNERRIFDLLVSTITTTNSAQYFLLTPKLLENLQYSEETTVLNVHNGAYAMDYHQWDVQQFMEIRLGESRKRRRSNSYNDENMDSNTMH